MEILITLIEILGALCYVAVGGLTGPLVYRAALNTSSYDEEKDTRERANGAQNANMAFWPILLFWALGHLRRVASEEQDLPAGLNRHQRRNLLYQRSLLAVLEQQQAAAEAVLEAATKSQALGDPSPLNLEKPQRALPAAPARDQEPLEAQRAEREVAEAHEAWALAEKLHADCLGGVRPVVNGIFYSASHGPGAHVAQAYDRLAEHEFYADDNDAYYERRS
jgi:hypothetical protein